MGVGREIFGDSEEYINIFQEMLKFIAQKKSAAYASAGSDKSGLAWEESLFLETLLMVIQSHFWGLVSLLVKNQAFSAEELKSVLLSSLKESLSESISITKAHQEISS